MGHDLRPAFYSVNRQVKSIESKTLLELSEAKQKIKKLEMQVKELQKNLQKHTLMKSQSEQFNMNSEHDYIMKYISGLIQVSKNQEEKAAQQASKMKGTIISLGQDLDRLQQSLVNIETKEKKILASEQDTGDRNELKQANSALKSEIQKKLSVMQKESHDMNVAYTQLETKKKTMRET